MNKFTIFTVFVVFSIDSGYAFKMVNFSVKHKSHFLLPHTYERALEAMHHFKLYCILLSFNSQMYFESSVIFSLFLFLKEVLWLLTLIWVGFSEVRFEVGGNYTPLSKTHQNCARNLKFGTKVHNICSFRKYTFQYQDPVNFADISVFFFLQKISIFWQKQYLYSRQQRESCVRNFQFCFQFLQDKRLLLIKM